MDSDCTVSIQYIQTESDSIDRSKPSAHIERKIIEELKEISCEDYSCGLDCVSDIISSILEIPSSVCLPILERIIASWNLELSSCYSAKDDSMDGVRSASADDDEGGDDLVCYLVSINPEVSEGYVEYFVLTKV